MQFVEIKYGCCPAPEYQVLQYVAFLSKSGIAICCPVTKISYDCCPAPEDHHVVKILSSRQTKTFPNPRSIFSGTDKNISKSVVNIHRDRHKYFQIQDQYLQGRNKCKFTMEGRKHSKWRPICCGNQQQQIILEPLAGMMFDYSSAKYFGFSLFQVRTQLGYIWVLDSTLKDCVSISYVPY